MGGTTTKDGDFFGLPGALRNFVVNFNKLVDDVEVLRASLYAARRTAVYGNPGFAIVSNFDVQNANAVHYVIDGTLKLLANAQTFDTGTAQVIVADKWSAALLTVSGTNTPTVTWSATLNAADETAAIAALPALPSGHVALGYVTVKTGAGVTWTAGTDALKTGTGGTPASETNYYNKADPLGTLFASIDAASDMTAAKIGDAVGTALAA